MIYPGQWMGSFTFPGFEPGLATLSIEKDQVGEAFACIYQGDSVPASRVDFAYTVSGDEFRAESVSGVYAFDKNSQRLVPASEHPLAKEGQVVLSKNLAIVGTLKGKEMNGEWRGDSGASGTFCLQNQFDASSAADHVMSWDRFRSYCSQDLFPQGKKLLFRGHASEKWQLSTTLHRLRMYDLVRYRDEACKPLVRELNARIGRRYDISKGEDFGAVLSLAQHHGFPTPLLDWTLSPYIAAYFAFASESTDDRRIFVFDSDEWSRLPQPASLSDPASTVSVREFESYDNPRHLPQQSVHTFSNVADIEGWIREIEKRTNTKYLTVIDIPRGEKKNVIRDLAYMGVTAASLFPGVDGACRALKEKIYNFE